MKGLPFDDPRTVGERDVLHTTATGPSTPIESDRCDSLSQPNSRCRRAKNRRYQWSAEQDDLIRRRYHGRGAAVTLAAALGVPEWQVRLRAARLGIPQLGANVRPWTAQEAAFLEEHVGSRSLDWLAKKLRRSQPAVAMKLRRLKISSRIREGYTVDDLELCFGTGHPVIERWIRQGLLAGKGRTGRAWRFTDEDVLRFIRENSTAFRLDRVDQTWFMDLVLGSRQWKESAA